MKLKNSTAEVFVPDGVPVPAALRRITHPGNLEFILGFIEKFSEDVKTKLHQRLGRA